MNVRTNSSTNRQPDYAAYFEHMPFDPEDPNPWHAFFLDRSFPIDESAKAAVLVSMQSRSRQYFLPVVRPLARIGISLIQIFKIFVPKLFTSSRFLHWLIYVGLKAFVRPDANYVIMRHFHLGSEILDFIATNAKDVDIPLRPLRPQTLADLKDDLFLKHDLNLFNFVIRLNADLRKHDTELQPAGPLDFSMITDDGDFGIEAFPNTWHNFIDVQTAIELYTPLYQLFLSDNDFWRASNSLQLDETVALYAARMVPGAAPYLGLLNNKHPMIPLSTLGAGFRLMLHGLATETLHAILVRLKQKQAAGIPL